jgi:flagellar protein FliJ
MSQFRFRLDTLLRLKKIARDERRTQLADAQRAEVAIAERQNELGQRQEQLEDQRRAIGRGPLDVARWIDADRYAQTLRAEQTDLAWQRENAAAEVERCRQHLVEADREVKTLEKLRDRQYETHRIDESRRESRANEERLAETASDTR